MPNWCSTAYAIEGDAQEIKSLYELMKRLEDMEKPSVENGFGTAWLGCLVDALGKDWNNVSCRGEWSCLEMDGEVIKLYTETAWSPCNEVFDLVREKYPSLHYYFQAEEPDLDIYETNDSEGIYFPDRYCLEICTLEGESCSEYFEQLQEVFEWFGDEFGRPVKSVDDIKALDAQWKKKNENSFCYLHEFSILK